MSNFKYRRQQKEYNQALSRKEFYESQIHKLDSKQKSLYTREFLTHKINRINKLLYYVD